MSETLQSLSNQAPPISSAAAGSIDILLLMKLPEAGFCGKAIHKVNPTLGLARAGNHEEIDQALPALSPNARLIGFSTAVVVSKAALAAFGGGCFNFHPGPPDYPGNRPSAFANYHKAETFGVTFHQMISKVDAGVIFDSERFPTAGLETGRDLAIKAYLKLAQLFINNVVALSNLDHPLPPNGEVWSGRKTTQADCDAMRRVPGDIDPTELERRIRAFPWVYTALDEDAPVL